MRRLVTLLGLLVLVGCGASGPQLVPIDPALATLVPPDTRLLVGIRVDKLRETETAEQLLFEVATPASLATFIEDTGLDPAKDLWELLFAHNGSDGVLMVRGRFSAMGLEPRFEREGVQRTPYRGQNLIGDDNAAVLFVNATTALLGSPPMLKSIVDSRAEYSGIPEPLMLRISTLDPGSHVWAVSSGGGLDSPLPAGNLANLYQFTGKVEGFTLSANFGSGLSLLVRGECPTPEAAENLLGGVKAMLVLARLGAKEQPAMAALVDAIGLVRKENSVELSASLAPELLEHLVQEMSGRPGP